MKVLCAPDKFRGACGAMEAAEALAKGVRAAGHEAVVQPLADGGEGTAQVLGPGVVESAAPPGDTWALGTGWLAAPMRVAHTLAIGGTASTDGGMGLLAELGYLFLDAHGRRLEPVGRSLAKLAEVRQERQDSLRGIALYDVQATLLQCLQYAPQKGATPAQCAQARPGLEVLASRFGDGPGFGSGGGLGLAAQVAGLELRPGAATVLDRLALHLEDFDLIFTGEGSLDAGTLQGKVVAELARRAPGRVVAFVGQARVALLGAEIIPLSGGPSSTVHSLRAAAAHRLRRTG